MRNIRLLVVSLALAGCGGSGMPGSTAADLGSAAAPDLSCGAPPDGGALHTLGVKVQLTDDGMGVALFAQNGSMVHVPKADIAGKTYYWATVKGGEQVTNAKMIDVGFGMIGGDLTASFTTAAHYTDGPWE